jgi:hypothetical protein
MTMEGQHRWHRQAGVRTPRPSAGRIALLLAILLAFTWQSFVTQTHVHVDPIAHHTQVAHPSKGGRSTSSSPETCPICRVIAESGHHLLPTSVVIQVPDVMAVWLLDTLPLVLTICLRSHAWQSRAPPA